MASRAAGRRLGHPERAQPDGGPDVALARLAAAQWGVASVADLAACGLGRRQVATRVAGGRLHRVHRGVYAVGHANLPLEGRFLAALKACGPQAVLSHFSAAASWGLVPWEERRVEVTVPGSAARVHAGVRVHRTTWLPDRHVAVRAGLALTSPVRTLIDVAGALDGRALRRVVGAALSLDLVGHAELASALARIGPRAGSGRLRALVACGPAPTRSGLEDAVLELIHRGRLAPPDVNVPLVLSGRRVVPDFRWPAVRLVLEADGAAWHEHRLAREADAERQAVLERHGERVLRVTWRQVTACPGETLERLRRAGAPRRSGSAAAPARRRSQTGAARHDEAAKYPCPPR